MAYGNDALCFIYFMIQGIGRQRNEELALQSGSESIPANGSLFSCDEEWLHPASILIPSNCARNETSPTSLSLTLKELRAQLV